MKVIVRTIQVITGLVLLFFCIGAFIPEFEYQTTTKVDAPKELAYQMFTDLDATEQWLTGFKSYENIQGDYLSEGSQWKVTIEQDGEEFEVHETITKVKPNEQFSFILDNDIMVVDIDVYFNEENGITSIKTKNRVKPKGLFWRSLLPLEKPSMRSQAEKNYDKLAKLIESKKEVK